MSRGDRFLCEGGRCIETQIAQKFYDSGCLRVAIVYTNCYRHNVWVISGFDWDDDNVLHIERHGFTPDEVEAVFAGDYKVRRARQERYIALGETFDGRLAFVVFRRLRGSVIRVITARDMDTTERRLFRRK